MPRVDWNALTTRDMAYLVQVEPRRIQYYKDAGLISPRVQAEGKRGKPILYNRRNVLEAFVVWILREKCAHGIPVIKGVMERIAFPYDEEVFGVEVDDYLIETMPFGDWEIRKINLSAQSLAEQICHDYDTPSFKVTSLYDVVRRVKEWIG